MNLSNLLLIPFVLSASKISCGSERQNLIIHSVKTCFPWFVLNQLPYNLFCCPYFLCNEKQQRIFSYSYVPCHSLFYTLLSYHTTCSQKLMILVLLICLSTETILYLWAFFFISIISFLTASDQNCIQYLRHRNATEVLVTQQYYLFFSLFLITHDLQFAFLTSGEYWADFS